MLLYSGSSLESSNLNFSSKTSRNKSMNEPKNTSMKDAANRLKMLETSIVWFMLNVRARSGEGGRDCSVYRSTVGRAQFKMK